ncbi:MAG: beta-glucosidase [Clostridia bacterium]|nr:beta-glucosidase [Clostridia bacterium]
MKKDKFIWGTASSSYQIEGATNEDGRCKSIWDTFSEKEGNTIDGDTGAVACDHYHRYAEDVAIMKNLGVDAYRFSVAWSRIIREDGSVNEKGLDFYQRLSDELLKSGITPYLCFYHWDMPEFIYQKGGYANRDFSNYFADLANAVVDKLGDRVHDYLTINEPQCAICAGCESGVQAPGDKLSEKEVLKSFHNIMLSHGKSASIIREKVDNSTVAIASICQGGYPLTDSQKDIEAARRYNLDDFPSYDGQIAYFDAMQFGDYPKSFYDKHDMTGIIKDGDMKIIAQPVDYIGLNVYGGYPIEDKDGVATRAKLAPGYPANTFGWAVGEKALYWAPKFFYDRYKTPIVITENGTCMSDWVSLDGKVHDPNRIDFMARYLGEIQRANRDGIDIRGYFAWSIMDNYEWQAGYSKRFGMVFVDYETQKRIPKDSYYWFKEFINKNR